MTLRPSDFEKFRKDDHQVNNAGDLSVLGDDGLPDIFLEHDKNSAVDGIILFQDQVDRGL